MIVGLWDLYENGEINDKTKYWADLWGDSVENFENNSRGLNLLNPHLLLMDIIDEIRFNRLRNKKNKTYFQNKVGEMLKSDPIIETFFKSDFTLVAKELMSHNRPDYFLSLCENIIKSFQDGFYFKQSCDSLKDILLKSKWDDEDKDIISLISQNLIVEFILLGYSMGTIKDMPLNLFSKYDKFDSEDGELLITKFPTSLKYKDFKDNNKINLNAYNEAIKNEIDGLSVSDRIESLKIYYDAEPHEGYAVLKVEGITGNVDINIGNVNFYTPSLKSHMGDEKAEDFEVRKLKIFGNEGHTSSFINAAVKIKYRDVDSAKKSAIESINKAIDLLRCYVCSEIPFKIVLNKFVIDDMEDFHMVSVSAKGEPHYIKSKSYNLEGFKNGSNDDETYFKNVAKILFGDEFKKFQLADKLIYSLHWYRKAYESNNLEDKLLNYWIVIENLVTFDSRNENLILPTKDKETKILLAEELIPPIELTHFTREVSIELYRYLSYLVNSLQGDSKSMRPLLELPKSHIEACKLTLHHEGGDIKEFLANIPPLINLVHNPVIKDKIIFTNNFYSDNNFTYQEMLKQLEQTKQDLFLIYRYRNLIVHNAQFDNTVLPYYIEKAERFAGNTLRAILYEFIMDSTKSHERILLSNKVKMQRMLDKLNNNESVDLWSF